MFQVCLRHPHGTQTGLLHTCGCPALQLIDRRAGLGDLVCTTTMSVRLWCSMSCVIVKAGCEDIEFLFVIEGALTAGHVMVVDGGAWLWREPLVDRSAVSKVSRAVETNSRQVGTASQSKL